VYEAVRSSPLLAEVIIATDSEEIMKVCRKHDWKAQMTSPAHRSGTERVHEISQTVDAEVYINVQGDEPMVRSEQIGAIVHLMKDPEIQVGTLKTPAGPADVSNPNAVKVVTDLNGRALYFSRATSPFDRDGSQPKYFKHLGIYAYRKPALQRFVTRPESSLERAERLEQQQAGAAHQAAVGDVEDRPHGMAGAEANIETDLRFENVTMSHISRIGADITSDGGYFAGEMRGIVIIGGSSSDVSGAAWKIDQARWPRNTPYAGNPTFAGWITFKNGSWGKLDLTAANNAVLLDRVSYTALIDPSHRAVAYSGSTTASPTGSIPPIPAMAACTRSSNCEPKRCRRSQSIPPLISTKLLAGET